VIKQFPWQYDGLFLLLMSLAGLAFRSLPLLIAAAVFLPSASGYQKIHFNRRFGVSPPLIDFISATGRRYLMLSHHLGFHMIRYYLVPLMAVSIIVPELALPLGALALLPAAVVYNEKRPAIGFPTFLLFFWLEQIFYQAGVLWGCLKQRSFRMYRVSPVQVGRWQRAKPR
jgi:hypothetical protein